MTRSLVKTPLSSAKPTPTPTTPGMLKRSSSCLAFISRSFRTSGSDSRHSPSLLAYWGSSYVTRHSSSGPLVGKTTRSLVAVGCGVSVGVGVATRVGMGLGVGVGSTVGVGVGSRGSPVATTAGVSRSAGTGSASPHARAAKRVALRTATQYLICRVFWSPLESHLEFVVSMPAPAYFRVSAPQLTVTAVENLWPRQSMNSPPLTLMA